MQGQYSIHTHQGETGLFAEVELSVEYKPGHSDQPLIHFSFAETLPDVLETSVKFGCYNALEKLPIHLTDQHLYINILKVRWHAIDTYTALVAMAGGRALINAFQKEELSYPLREQRKITFTIGGASISNFI